MLFYNIFCNCQTLSNILMDGVMLSEKIFLNLSRQKKHILINNKGVRSQYLTFILLSRLLPPFA